MVQLFRPSKEMINGPHVLVLVRVLGQRVVSFQAWLVVYGDLNYESPLDSPTITSFPTPLLGHPVGSGTHVLSVSPGTLGPQ